MASDKEIIELYLYKNEDKSWGLSVEEICLASKISRAWLYKVLKSNNIPTRERKNKVDVEQAWKRVKLAIKLYHKAVKQSVKLNKEEKD